MVVNVFLLLALLGVSALPFRENKYSRFLAFLFWAAAAGIFWYFCRNWLAGTVKSFIFHWIQYKELHIDIDLSSNERNYLRIFPLFLMGIMSLLYNAFISQESQRVRLSGQMCLNLAFLILLICTNNLIFMMISSFLIGILGIYIINDYEIKKTYIFYNLISDMAMFAAFAMVYGQFGKVEVSVLTQYGKSGNYINLVAMLLLLSLFIKNGLFLFQNQLLCFRDLTFNRLIFLSFCSIPVCGIIIYGKIFAILLGFEYVRPVVAAIAILSAGYAVLGALIYDDIKEKTLCLNMLFWSFLYGISLFSHQLQFIDYVRLFILWYILNSLIYAVVVSASYEIYVSKMGGFFRSLWPEFLLFVVWAFALLQTLLVPEVPETVQNYIIWSFLILSGIALAHFLHEAFFGCCHAGDMVSALLKIAHPAFWLPSLAVLGWYVYHEQYRNLTVWGAISVFLILIAAYPFRRLSRFYNNEEVQLSEFFGSLYDYIIVAPITIVGRMLWLTVDFVIIERTILNSINRLTGFLIGISRKIHQSSVINYIMLTLLGLGIMLTYVRG